MTTILIIGTYDTKQDELAYLAQIITAQDAEVIKMDVSVLGEVGDSVDMSKHDVIAAAQTSIAAIIAYEDENAAFQKMAEGAAILTATLYAQGKIDGMIALGGTMGTDLALDCAAVLPMGVPKYIVSTVAFSPLINVQRIAPDIQMILWAGGLYGLNSICKSTLAQAGGAVVGAAKAMVQPGWQRPMVAITSLGKTALNYMVKLLPELEKRGFDVAVFHSTGLGGRAFESLAAQGRFACVMDFCLQEFINGICQSPVQSGSDRLTNAGRAGIAQMIAPGASDMIDLLAANALPERFIGRECHAHNRLISSVSANDEEREQVARQMAQCLTNAEGPVHLFIPLGGMNEWDKPGQPLHNPRGLSRFIDALRQHVAPHIATTELDCHINDDAFTNAVLDLFDNWVNAGLVAR